MKLDLKIKNSFELDRTKFSDWWKKQGRTLVWRANATAAETIDLALTQDHWKTAVITTNQSLQDGKIKQGFKIDFK